MLKRFKNLIPNKDIAQDHPEYDDSLASNAFVCPICMQTFPAPEALQIHYDAEHGTPPQSPVSNNKVYPNNADDAVVSQLLFDNSTNNDGHLTRIELKSELESPLLTRSSNTDFSNLNALTAKDNAPEVESGGSFTCPQCMAQLDSADSLQLHFSALHEILSENRDGDVLAMRHELNDLRASLKEEKWYSNELKKELDRLQAHLSETANQSSTTETVGNEMGYYVQQIQALEAGKALATTKLLDLEKETSDLKRLCDSVKRERDRIVEKCASLATEHATVRAQLDDEGSQKVLLTTTIEKLQKELHQLQQMLDQRPSEDDVNVLRKELVHAQQLMDDITLSRESELQSLRQKCDNLENNAQQNEKFIVDLTSQLSSAPTNAELQNLQRELEISANEKNNLFAKFTSLEVEFNQIQQVLIEKDACIQEYETKCHGLDADIDLLKSNLSIKVNEKRDAENQLENYKRMLEESIGQKQIIDASIGDLAMQCDLLQNQYRQQCLVASDLKTSLRDLQLELDSRNRENEKKDEKMIELEAVTQQLKSDLDRYANEKMNLLQKINEGEGANEALTQISSNNSRLSHDLSKIKEDFQAYKQKYEQDLNSSYKATESLKIDLANLTNKMNLLTEENDSLRAIEANLKEKCISLEADIKHKVTLLSVAEQNGAQQREDMSKHLEDMKMQYQEKLRQIEELTPKYNSLQDENLALKDRSGKSEFDCADLKRKIEELQEKNKLLSQDVINAQIALSQLSAAASENENILVAYKRDLMNAQNNVEKLEVAIKEEKKNLAAKDTLLSESRSTLETEMASLKSELKLSEHSKNRLEEEIKELKSEQNNFIASSKEEKLKLEATLATTSSKLEQIRGGYEQKIKEIEVDLNKKHNDYVAALSKNDSLENRLATTLSDKNTIAEKQANLETKFEKLNLTFTEQLEEVSNLKSLLDKRDYEISALKDSIRTNNDKFNSVNQKTESIEKMCKELEIELVEKNSSIANLRERLETSASNQDSVQVQLANIKDELETKKCDLELVKKQSFGYEQSKLHLERELDERNKAFEAVCAIRIALEKEVVALKSVQAKQKSDYEREVYELEQTKNALKQRKADLEDCNHNLEIRLSEIETSKKVIESKLTTSQQLFAEMKEQAAALEAELEKQKFLWRSEATEREKDTKTLSDSFEATKEELESAQQRLVAVETQCNDIKKERNELQTQVNAWHDEKRVLMERCVSIEQDLEIAQSKNKELQRRYDDTLSAMHELGRENQTLQIDISKQFGRKWVEDSDAVNCNSCGKEFSVTIRKHHCRNCGLIYCQDCSEKQATVASSKKPVRVCDNCYVELNSR